MYCIARIGAKCCLLAVSSTESKTGGSLLLQVSSSRGNAEGLTRIRPNYSVFKGVFFGPNPLELNIERVKIGAMATSLRVAHGQNNPKLLD